MNVHLKVQLVELWTPGEKTPAESLCCSTSALPEGMAGDLWPGSPEGQVRPVSGLKCVQSLGDKSFGLNSAGQQELCDRAVSDATSHG